MRIQRKYFGLPAFSAVGGEGGGGAPGGAAPGGNPGGAGGAPGGDPAGAGAAPPAAPALPWQAEEGQPWKVGDKAWWELIPEDPVREHMGKKAYRTPAELAVAYTNLERLHSGAADVIALPPTEAGDDAWKDVYKRLGALDTPDAYDIKMPDGVDADPKFLELGKNVSHKLGLSPKQAQTLADNWNEFVQQYNADAVEQMRNDNEKALSELKSSWGADLDANLAAGQRVMKAVGLSEADVAAVEANIGSAAVVKMLAMIGRKSDEGGFTGGAGGDPTTPEGMTQEQAAAAIPTAMADPAYSNKNDPNHKNVVDKVQRLFARAGDKAVI